MGGLTSSLRIIPLVLLVSSRAAWGQVGHIGAPADSDERVLLFLDNQYAASTANVARVLHQPTFEAVSHMAEGVNNWGCSGPAVWYDPTNRTYRCWYASLKRAPNYNVYTLYAESTNGIAFVPKSVPNRDPDVDVTAPTFGYNPPPHNLVYWTGPNFLGAGVTYDPVATEPGRRFVLTVAHGNFAAGWPGSARNPIGFSPDGMDFTLDSAHPWYPAGNNTDGSNVIRYDPVNKRYLLSCRPGLGDRRIAMRQSTDLKTWTDPVVVLEPDEGDTATAQFYGIQWCWYYGIWIGQLWFMDTPASKPGAAAGTIWIELVWSYDGTTWIRNMRDTPFIPNRPTGEYGYGAIQMSSMVESPDRTRLGLFGNGFIVDHSQVFASQDSGTPPSEMLSYSLRRDGFVSLRAGRETGRVVTAAFRAMADSVRINASLSGMLRAELRTPDGAVVSGYSFADSVPMTGDVLDEKPRWTGDVAIPQGEHVLALAWEDGDLYAVRYTRPAHLKVFLFGGQSNMAGADAVIDSSNPPTSYTNDLATMGAQTAADMNTLFCYGWGESQPAYAWGDIRGHAGKHFDTYAVGGQSVKNHGPEVGFARTLYASGITGIAIIKVANNFSAYENGMSPWVASNSYWNGWQAFVTDRLTELTAQGHTYEIAGFVWHQGIDDGLLRRGQPAYAADLAKLIDDLRREYDTADTPFVLARSVNSAIAGSAAMAPIRAGQVAVADADPSARWIDVDDLAPYVNTHHLTSAAQLTAGRRLAEAYLSLQASKPESRMPLNVISGQVRTDDTQILAAGNANNNSGGKTTFAVGIGYYTGTHYPIRGLVRFDLSALAGKKVTAARLELVKTGAYSSTGNPFTDTVAVHAISSNNAAWNEGTGDGERTAVAGEATWNNRIHPSTPWTGGGGLETAGTAYQTPSLATFSMAYGDSNGTVYTGRLADVSVAQGWIDHPDQNAGIFLKGEEARQSWYKCIFLGSSENANSNNWPRLVLDLESEVPDPDADRDGIPDDWENQYGGTDLFRTGGDYDQDGMNDDEERIAGTTPTNALSVLRITAIHDHPGAMLVFPGISGRTYRAQWSTNLLSSNWWLVPHTSVSVTADGDASLIDTNDGPFKFYRLTVE